MRDDHPFKIEVRKRLKESGLPEEPSLEVLLDAFVAPLLERLEALEARLEDHLFSHGE